MWDKYADIWIYLNIFNEIYVHLPKKFIDFSRANLFGFLLVIHFSWQIYLDDQLSKFYAHEYIQIYGVVQKKLISHTLKPKIFFLSPKASPTRTWKWFNWLLQGGGSLVVLSPLFGGWQLGVERMQRWQTIWQALLFSRPGRSQGLLFKHLCNSLINSVMVCENIFTAPPYPNGWR